MAADLQLIELKRSVGLHEILPSNSLFSDFDGSRKLCRTVKLVVASQELGSTLKVFLKIPKYPYFASL